MTEKQMIAVVCFVVVTLFGVLGWSLNQNFQDIKDGQKEIKHSLEENRHDIKINFRELSGLSARISMVEK